MKYIKTTNLLGYYNTGDQECFCFDKHSGPEDHKNYLKEVGYLRSYDADGILITKPSREDLPEDFDPNSCRIYPNKFLPEELKGKRVKGNWKITVEFEPEEDV